MCFSPPFDSFATVWLGQLRLQKALTPKVRENVQKAKIALEKKLGRKLCIYKILGVRLVLLTFDDVCIVIVYVFLKG